MGGYSKFSIYKYLRFNTGSTYRDSKVVAGIENLGFQYPSNTWRIFSSDPSLL
jgi:hypothetical protein